MDAICEAAALLLDRSGYEALSTNAIARVAGVSIGSLYQYFGDKDAIVVELARRLEARALDAAMQRAASIDVTDPRGVTASLIGVLLDPALGSLATRRALLLQVPPAWVLPASGPTDASTERLLATVMDTLALRDGPRDVMSFVVFHAVEGAIEHAIIRRPEWLAEPGFREELFALAWRYAAPPGAALEARALEPPRPWPEAAAELTARLADEPAPSPSALPRRVAPTTARGRASVEAMLAAMLEVLAEGGWAAASARAVARRAGVSPATLYRYFPDLRAMVSELARRRRARTLELIAPRLSEPGDAPLERRIHGVVGALVERLRGEGHAPRTLLAQVPQAWVREVTDEMFGAIAALAERRIDEADGARPGDPAQRAAVVSAALSHCLDGAVIARPALLDDPAFVDELVVLASRYLVG